MARRSSSTCRRPSSDRELGRGAARPSTGCPSATAGRDAARAARRRDTRSSLAPYLGSRRLVVARLTLDAPLRRVPRAGTGSPIRYGYVAATSWPIDAYQTVFAREPGSAEMPSAARPFTAELVTELVARGVLVRADDAPHRRVLARARRGPYPERYRVPAATARLVNAVRGWGGRVIAVGTTVVRALETVGRRRTASCAPARARRAWSSRPSAACAPSTACSPAGTSPSRRTCSCSKRRPAPSCSALLRRRAGRGYRFHEFGDSHLILP